VEGKPEKKVPDQVEQRAVIEELKFSCMHPALHGFLQACSSSRRAKRGAALRRRPPSALHTIENPSHVTPCTPRLSPWRFAFAPDYHVDVEQRARFNVTRDGKAQAAPRVARVIMYVRSFRPDSAANRAIKTRWRQKISSGGPALAKQRPGLRASEAAPCAFMSEFAAGKLHNCVAQVFRSFHSTWRGFLFFAKPGRASTRPGHPNKVLCDAPLFDCPNFGAESGYEA